MKTDDHVVSTSLRIKDGKLAESTLHTLTRRVIVDTLELLNVVNPVVCLIEHFIHLICLYSIISLPPLLHSVSTFPGFLAEYHVLQ